MSKIETIRVSAASIAALDHPANHPNQDQGGGRYGRMRDRRGMTPRPANQYVMVETVDKDDKIVGERVVDLNHIDTFKWFPGHCRWAQAEGYMVEIRPISKEEADKYTEVRAAELQKRYAR